VDGQDWVEQVGEPDTVCFGNKTKEMPVPIETPGAALLHYFDARFVMAK
jgi:hypothetical protein